MYDPSTGEFVSADPIGFNDGSTNPYTYCGDNPTNFTDPSGLQEQPAQVKGPYQGGTGWDSVGGFFTDFPDGTRIYDNARPQVRPSGAPGNGAPSTNIKTQEILAALNSPLDFSDWPKPFNADGSLNIPQQQWAPPPGFDIIGIFQPSGSGSGGGTQQPVKTVVSPPFSGINPAPDYLLKPDPYHIDFSGGYQKPPFPAFRNPFTFSTSSGTVSAVPGGHLGKKPEATIQIQGTINLYP